MSGYDDLVFSAVCVHCVSKMSGRLRYLVLLLARTRHAQICTPSLTVAGRITAMHVAPASTCSQPIAQPFTACSAVPVFFSRLLSGCQLYPTRPAAPHGRSASLQAATASPVGSPYSDYTLYVNAASLVIAYQGMIKGGTVSVCSTALNISVRVVSPSVSLPSLD